MLISDMSPIELKMTWCCLKGFILTFDLYNKGSPCIESHWGRGRWRIP